MNDNFDNERDDKAIIEAVPGREGIAATGARRLVTFVEMPDRRKEDWQARNMLRESDIREAMAKGARRLHDEFMKRDYGNVGFVFNPDNIEYDITRLGAGMDISADPAIKAPPSLARTLVAHIRIER